MSVETHPISLAKDSLDEQTTPFVDEQDEIAAAIERAVEEKQEPSSLEILEADPAYADVIDAVKSVDDSSAFSLVMCEEALPEGHDVLVGYAKMVRSCDSQVKISHDLKSLEIGYAAKDAKERVVPIVRVVNAVARDFNLKNDEVQQLADQTRDGFLEETAPLKTEAATIQERYDELMVQNVSIYERLIAIGDILASHIKDLAERHVERETERADIFNLESEHAIVFQSLAIIQEEMGAYGASGAVSYNSLDADDLKNKRSSITRKINDHKVSIGYLDIRIQELRIDIDACKEKSEILKEEAEKVRIEAKELILRSGVISKKIDMHGNATTQDIDSREVEGAPDFMHHKHLTAEIVNCNPESALESLGRSRPDLVGEAAAKSDIAVKRVVENAPSERLVTAIVSDEKKLRNTILPALIGHPEVAQYHDGILRDILIRAGLEDMLPPKGSSVVGELTRLHTEDVARQQVAATLEPEPAILQGGKVESKRSRWF